MSGKDRIQKNAHLLVEKEKLSVTNFALEDFERVFFTVQNAKNRGGESRHSKWRPSLKLNERHHCKIKSESLLLLPTLKWGSFVKKKGRSWKSHFWQAFMTSEYGIFLRGYERNIFRAARRGGTSLSLSPTPPPQRNAWPLRQVTFVLFQRLHFHFKSKKRSLHLCSHFFFVKKPDK